MQDSADCDYFRTPAMFQVPDIYRFFGYRLCDNVFLLSSFVIVSAIEDRSSFRTIISFRVCAKSPISSNSSICAKPSIFVHLLYPRCSFMIIFAHRYFLRHRISTVLLELVQVLINRNCCDILYFLNSILRIMSHFKLML